LREKFALEAEEHRQRLIEEEAIRRQKLQEEEQLRMQRLTEEEALRFALSFLLLFTFLTLSEVTNDFLI